MTYGLYIHNFAEMGEPTPDAIADTFNQVPHPQVRFKTHQWLSWNGAPKSGGYDTSPYAITSLTRVQARCDDFRSRHVTPIPWCVPMGLDTEREAQFAADVAHIAGAIDFDLEPYADFWPALPKGDYSQVAPFFKRVRELVPDAEITLDFPARNTAWEWAVVKHAVELAAPYVDRFALQSYFGVGQAMDAERRVKALVPGKPIDHIVTPPMLGPALSDHLENTDATRLLIWLARDMNATYYQRLKATPLSESPDPTPTPAPAHAWQEPGFAALRRAAGARMGDPNEDAHADGQGNVWQAGDAGVAVWMKAFNRNYWLGRDGTVRSV